MVGKGEEIPEISVRDMIDRCKPFVVGLVVPPRKSYALGVGDMIGQVQNSYIHLDMGAHKHNVFNRFQDLKGQCGSF